MNQMKMKQIFKKKKLVYKALKLIMEKTIQIKNSEIT